jgi:hypothetical protein
VPDRYDWHPAAGRGKGEAMTDPTPPDRRPRFGGGAPIALLTIAGTIIGGLLGQPSIGLLTGLGIGVLVAIAIWWTGPR